MLGDSMFYGSGAGSLPTASAVVGDVIDAVRHLNRSLFVFWDPEKLELSDHKTAVRPFFIRVPLDKKDEAMKLFNASEAVTSDDVPGEAAMITSLMSEEEFENKYNEAGYVISRIRVNQ